MGGMARFFGARGTDSQWSPATEIMDLLCCSFHLSLPP